MKEDFFRKFNSSLKRYENELSRGKRAGEIIAQAGPLQDLMKKVLKDAEIGGIEGMVNDLYGVRASYSTTDQEKEKIRELKKRYKALVKRANELPACPHDDVAVLSYFPGGFDPPSIDVQCKKCDSVFLVQDHEKISVYLNLGFSDIIPFDKRFIDACKERNIPRKGGAPPTLLVETMA
jgi:hypothetical protein